MVQRGASRRVLLVDDNRDAAAALELLLKDMGHRTPVVHGGAEAIEKILSDDLDCVFLDLGMPGIDGYEVARRVRASSLARQPQARRAHGLGTGGRPAADARRGLRRASREAGERRGHRARMLAQ